MTTTASLLDRLLHSVSECFTPDVARQIAALRADSETQSRLNEYAVRANEGDLTEAERAEYTAAVGTIDLISVLQAQARIVVNRTRQDD